MEKRHVARLSCVRHSDHCLDRPAAEDDQSRIVFPCSHCMAPPVYDVVSEVDPWSYSVKIDFQPIQRHREQSTVLLVKSATALKKEAYVNATKIVPTPVVLLSI